MKYIVAKDSSGKKVMSEVKAENVKYILQEQPKAKIHNSRKEAIEAVKKSRRV